MRPAWASCSAAPAVAGQSSAVQHVVADLAVGTRAHNPNNTLCVRVSYKVPPHDWRACRQCDSCLCLLSLELEQSERLAD